MGMISPPPCIPSGFTTGVVSEYRDSPCHACSSSLQRPFSRFAVRYVHRFYLTLPSNLPFRRVLLLCWFTLPFGNGGALLLRLCESCHSHIKSPSAFPEGFLNEKCRYAEARTFA